MAIDTEVKKRHLVYENMPSKPQHNLIKSFNEAQSDVYILENEKIQEYKDANPVLHSVASVAYSIFTGTTIHGTYELLKEGDKDIAYVIAGVGFITFCTALWAAYKTIQESRRQGQLEIEILQHKEDYLDLPTIGHLPIENDPQLEA